MPHVNNPWIDFKFGTNYASDFGLLRVSSGSRYNDNLIPTLNDKTAETPGGDGMYYFNSYYKQKQFNINFAYDHLTETNLHAVRKWLNGKEIKELEFDERPGRFYFAKVTGAPSFKYLPFDTYDHKSNNLYVSNFELLTQLSSSARNSWPTSHVQYNVNGTYIRTSGTTYKIGSIIIIAKNTYSQPYAVRLCPNPDQSVDDTTGTVQFAWNSSGVRSDTRSIEFKLPFDSSLRSTFAQFGTFTDTEPGPFTPEVIYKGEGSVTFTCYDPFAYGAPQEQARSSWTASLTLGGDLPTPLLIQSGSNLPTNTIIQLGDINITLTQNTTGTLSIDTKTGMVKDQNGPVAFRGRSMCDFDPTFCPYDYRSTVPNSTTIRWSPRYY